MLQHFVQMVPMLFDVHFGKSSVFLYDLEKYIDIKMGSTIVLPIKVGDKLTPGSASYESIHRGEKVLQKIEEEVLGVAYYAVAYPIVINGEIVGGIAVAQAQEMQDISERLQSLAQNLSASLQQVSAAVENIGSSAQELANGGQTVAASSQDVYTKAQQMEEVVEYIDSVAMDTKLLGLNASIEAARAGEVGRGFGVVASEIRTMAISSASSAKDIRKIIVGIQGLIGNMTVELERFSSNTEEVSASIGEIGATIESLTQAAIELATLSEKL